MGTLRESITRLPRSVKVCQRWPVCGQIVDSLLIYIPDRGRRYVQFGLIMAAMVTSSLSR